MKLNWNFTQWREYAKILSVGGVVIFAETLYIVISLGGDASIHYFVMLGSLFRLLLKYALKEICWWSNRIKCLGID